MDAWIDKYKPTTLKDLLIPEDTPLLPINYLIKKFIDTDQCIYSGFVLYGNGGSGKTAFADFLSGRPGWITFRVKETGVGKAEIDQIEKDIVTYNWDGFGQKVLVLANELSQCSKEFRDGLRGIIDNYRGKVFIIATDNNVAKLINENPQLIGVRRILTIDWDLIPISRIVERCAEILVAENELTDVNYARLELLAKTYSPDIGSVLQMLQVFVDSRKVTNENTN